MEKRTRDLLQGYAGIKPEDQVNHVTEIVRLLQYIVHSPYSVMTKLYRGERLGNCTPTPALVSGVF